MSHSLHRRRLIGSSLVTAAGLVGAACAARTDSRALKLGQIDLSFHVASAAVVRSLLTQAGVQHSVVTYPHEKIYDMLGKGEIDMAVSAWLPGSHGAYVAPYEKDLIKLGVLYEPYTIWGVPDYVPESEVASLQGLAKPAVAQRMTRLIQGIGPGAGISRFSREIVARYRLDALGYEFRNGSLEDCVGAFERAVAERRWVVVPLWHPQYLHSMYRIRALADPDALLRGKDAATLVLRRDAAGLIPPELLARLARMGLGNAAVAQLDFMLSREKLDPLQAADRWIRNHPAEVATWG
ncbi:MAG: glycine/betaine ABC transporter substrate-binding protein [Burkholderiaceae bacterium]|jgi:glycine betaine/proline transport system substrate-binding protein|nr:glycine/betaine ABC transporter substrate-binding protein [Burkholderiaceae bacterium]